MSIRKIVDVHHYGVDFPGPGGSAGNEYDYRFVASNGRTPYRPSSVAPGFFRETDTRWVRIWANWNALQGTTGASDPGTPAQNLGPERLAALDGQIKAARADGLFVIVVAWLFPTWANGSDDSYVIPKDANGTALVGPTDPWGKWIDWLYNRYRPGGPAGTDIQVLEVCNEPNGQMKPQTNIAHITARMLSTAQAHSRKYDHSIFLAGPATDETSSTDGATPWYTFTDNLLDALPSVGFTPHSKFIWTQHNYQDVEDPKVPPRSEAARDKLVGRWAGYSEGDGPTLFVSEGGARLGKVSGSEATQRDLVNASLTTLNGSSKVHMASNYLFYNEKPTDAGVVRPYTSADPIHPRLAYGDPGWSRPLNSLGGLPRFQSSWTDLSGPYQGSPAICSMRRGHLEAFAIGTDNALWHRWFAYGGWFGGPASLGGSCLYDPAAVSRADGIMDVFVVGPDRQLWTKWANTGGWASGFAPLGGSCYSGPAVCSMNSGHLQVFVRTSDGQTWLKWWTAAAGWTSGWAPLGGNTPTGPAAISRYDGSIDVFVIGTDGHLWHRWYSGGAWNGDWSPLGGPAGGLAAVRPAASSWRSNRVDVFAKGNDGKIWRRFWDSGAPWSDWEPLAPGLGAVDSGPAAVSWNRPVQVDDRIDLVVRRGAGLSTTWNGVPPSEV